MVVICCFCLKIMCWIVIDVNCVCLMVLLRLSCRFLIFWNIWYEIVIGLLWGMIWLWIFGVVVLCWNWCWICELVWCGRWLLIVVGSSVLYVCWFVREYVLLVVLGKSRCFGVNCCWCFLISYLLWCFYFRILVVMLSRNILLMVLWKILLLCCFGLNCCLWLCVIWFLFIRVSLLIWGVLEMNLVFVMFLKVVWGR